MARIPAFPRTSVTAVLLVILLTGVRAGEAASGAPTSPAAAPEPPPRSATRPAPLPPDARARVLRQMFPQEGFDYFSGRAGSSHNLPAMYAYRDDSGERLAVVGRDGRQEFPMNRAAEAFEAYRALLARSGYNP